MCYTKIKLNKKPRRVPLKIKPNVDDWLPLFSGQNPVSFPRLADLIHKFHSNIIKKKIVHSFYTELIFGINKITFHIKMFSLTS